VFGECGYKKASVEQIIKEAGISKGSLFYYFESKKNFYLYLYEYCAAQMKQMIDVPSDDGLPAYIQITDFFERLRAVQLLKSKYTKEYPHAYLFMKNILTETSPVVHNEVKELIQTIIKERTVDFYYNLDEYKFKEGIDPKMVLQLLTWCSEGCANTIMIKHKAKHPSDQASYDFQEIVTIYNSYVELLRKNFYKEEYL
ncbi:MAG TPA: TetR/AcrR family transcriptional regulator, partial [Mobilitalea sp.]|nr:TetR/AcrR family transcriptional regulator [Mobilitalea sp.]